MLCEPPPPFNPAFHLRSGPVEILAFGRKPRDKKSFDWNLARADIDTVSSYDELERPMGLAEALENISRQFKLANILAPNTSAFNAAICKPQDLTQQAFDSQKANIAVACGVPGGVRRGVDADGVALPPHHTFAVASADCPTLIVWNQKTGETAAAHAGFRSLCDHDSILQKGAARKHWSVVDSIMEVFKRDRREDLRAFIACGIGGDHFRHDPHHPEFGKKNKVLLYRLWEFYRDSAVNFDTGVINLKELIKIQLVLQGMQISAIGFDHICTFSDMDESGHTFWSYRRGDKKERNLVLVTRRW